tara:strand:+ start:184 stop:300 length:117 start_codon:yes stop_codon:yes gene_type:complete
MKITTKNTNVDVTKLTLDLLESKITSKQFKEIITKLNK